MKEPVILSAVRTPIGAFWERSKTSPGPNWAPPPSGKVSAAPVSLARASTNA